MTTSTGCPEYLAPSSVESFHDEQSSLMDARVPLHFQLPPTKKVRVMVIKEIGDLLDLRCAGLTLRWCGTGNRVATGLGDLK